MRNKDVIQEFEKHLSSNQKDVRDYVVNNRRIVQLILAGVLPFGILISGRLLDWDNLISEPNLIPGIIFALLWIVQAALAQVSLYWTPKIDKFTELAELRRMLVGLREEASAFQDSSKAFWIALAALRFPKTPREEAPDVSPLLSTLEPEDKFKQLAQEILSVFDIDEVLRLLGNGRVPKQFSASLYKHSGTEEGEALYIMVDRRGTNDFWRVRGRGDDARAWRFNEVILRPVSNRSNPYVFSDLQEAPGVPQQRQRPYDKQLYRGAMFARSDWYFRNGHLLWDDESSEPPAYLLIFTSGETEAFENCKDNTSGELLIEAIRDLLDTLLVVAYKG